jgi:hypothetical protein
LVRGIQSNFRIGTKQDQIDDERLPRFVLAQVVQALREERHRQGQNVEGLAAERDVVGTEHVQAESRFDQLVSAMVPRYFVDLLIAEYQNVEIANCPGLTWPRCWVAIP